MSLARSLTKCTLALSLCTAVACVVDDEDMSSGFRCLETDDEIDSIGMIGLDLVEVSGAPVIAGPSASLFSNKLVALSGTYVLAGDAVGGGHVTIDGGYMPDGAVIEGAGTVTVDDPTADVAAAATINDNASIGCVLDGENCITPLTGHHLAISGTSGVTLSTGTYYFESISVDGLGLLHVDGDVVIYLNGPATFNGGSATNPSSDSLTIISSSTEEIKLNGASEAQMRILAPQATVRFSGTQGFKGSALAKTLRISGEADLYVLADFANDPEVGCAPTPAPAPGGETPPNVPEIPN